MRKPRWYAQREKSEVRGNVSQRETPTDASMIRSLIEKYANQLRPLTLFSLLRSVGFRRTLFHPPVGHEPRFRANQAKCYTRLMGAIFSERELNVHDVSVHVYGDAAWANSIGFRCQFRKDGSPRDTWLEKQLYRREQGRWRLVHVHYSGMPVLAETPGF